MKSIDEVLEQVFAYGVATTSDDIIGNDTAYLNLKKHAVKQAKAELEKLMAAERLDELNNIMTTSFMGGKDGYGQIYHVINGDELETQQDRIAELEAKVRGDGELKEGSDE